MERFYPTERNSRRHGSAVDPERHPGQHDHQRGWEIRLQQEEEDVTPKSEVYVETIVPAWKTQIWINVQFYHILLH